MPRPPPHVPREPSAPPAPVAAGEADDATARRESLRQAFGRSETAGSSFAAESAKAFTAEALALARSNSHFISQIEARLDRFIEGTARREALEPMTRGQRALVHELARHYGIATQSYDSEPRRRVDLFRSEKTDWPSLRLSDAVKAAAAAAAAPAATAAGEEWALQLTQVECPELVLARALSFLDGEYLLRWSKRDDGGLPNVAIILTSEASACRTLVALGGGTRGMFRVEQPAWAARSSRQRALPPGLPPGLPPTQPAALAGEAAHEPTRQHDADAEDAGMQPAAGGPLAALEMALHRGSAGRGRRAGDSGETAEQTQAPKWRSRSAIAAQQRAAAEREAEREARLAARTAGQAEAPSDVAEPFDPADAELVEQLQAMGFAQARCVWAACTASGDDFEQRLSAATELLLQPVDPTHEFVEQSPSSGRAAAPRQWDGQSFERERLQPERKKRPVKLAQPVSVRVANPWDLLGDDDE